MGCAETDLEAEVDPSVETEEKLRAEEEAARQRLEVMQRCVELPSLTCTLSDPVTHDLHTTAYLHVVVISVASRSRHV